MEQKVQVTQEELSKIQEMNTEFSKLKLALGDLELNKQGLIKRVEMLRDQFTEHEHMLIAKYGQDAVINLQTGEVTKKEK